MKNILFIGIGDIGDVVMKTAILRATRQHLPEASIHVLAGSWNTELLKGQDFVDKIYCYDYPWGNLYYGLKKNWFNKVNKLFFLARSPLLYELRKQVFDAAISFSLSKMDYLLLFFLRSKMKIGCAGRWNDFFLTHPIPAITEPIITRIESDLLFLRALGIYVDYYLPRLQLNAQDRAELEIFLGNKVDIHYKIITICPGVGGPANKQWLPGYFAKVADILAGQNGNLVVLSGSPDEKTLIYGIQKQIKNKVLINCGDLSLRGFAALIEKSNLVICNNSAPMHMAAAFGRPAVVLNGGFNDQTEALKWGYKVNNIVILTADVGKRPADYRHPVCERHTCMSEIKPDFVLMEAQRLLNSPEEAKLIDHVDSKVFMGASCRWSLRQCLLKNH